VQDTVRNEVNSVSNSFENEWKDATAGLGDSSSSSSSAGYTPLEPPPPSYRHPKKNWRLKRGATPQWYKQRQGIRTKAQSGAARVARFRPPGVKVR
jgi:sec-independent protein translocase protein TatB